MAQRGIKNIQFTRTEVDGIQFASKWEAQRYGELKILQAAGKISSLECHVEFPLERGDIKVKQIRSDKVRTYTADFLYYEDRGGKWRTVVEDTKGRMTPIASLRMSVFKALYPQFVVLIVQRGKKPKEVR